MTISSTDQAKQNVLRVGITAPVSNLNPQEATDFVNILISWQIFEPPYGHPAGQHPPEPILFDEPLRIESSDRENTKFSVRVRAGIAFSDGTALTANHVATSLSSSKVLSGQARVQAQDDRVVFKLKKSDARFDLTLAQLPCAIVLNKGGSLLGTGPYAPAASDHPNEFRLVRNPNYTKRVNIPEVIFTVYPLETDGRPEKLLSAFEKGEVDLTQSLSREDVREIRRARTAIEAGHSTAILYFNVQRPGLRDRNVRKAISLAIDRFAIANRFYTNALAFAAPRLLPPVLDRSAAGFTHSNLEKAKAILAESGSTTSEPLSLLLISNPRPYLPNPRLAADLIVEQLSKLGLKVHVVPTSTVAEYYFKTSIGSYDMVLAGWIPDTPNPADFYETVLSSESIPDQQNTAFTRVNLSRWSNAAMDEALVQYRADLSEDSRIRIKEILKDEAPLVPLMYGPSVVVYSWRLKQLPGIFHVRPNLALLELQNQM